MGHRIAIMNDGVLQQIGPPQSVYETPATSSSPASSATRR